MKWGSLHSFLQELQSPLAQRCSRLPDRGERWALSAGCGHSPASEVFDPVVVCFGASDKALRCGRNKYFSWDKL